MASLYKNKIPSNFSEALRMCKDHAKAKHQLSVERIADEMGLSAVRLYQMLETGDMPIKKVKSFQRVCRCNYVTMYLAHGDDCMLVKMPKGKHMSDEQMLAFNATYSKALTELTEFYTNGQNPDGVIASLTQHMAATAWHRANVEKSAQPELDFESEEE